MYEKDVGAIFLRLGRRGPQLVVSRKAQHWPCPLVYLLLTSHTPSFLGTCRCFRCQSQRPEEGWASAHVILQRGLRGQGFQVVSLGGGAHVLLPGTYLFSMKVLPSALGRLRVHEHGPCQPLGGTLPAARPGLVGLLGCLCSKASLDTVLSPHHSGVRLGLG